MWDGFYNSRVQRLARHKIGHQENTQRSTTNQVRPRVLLMVIAKDIFTGTCRRSNWNGKSDCISEIRGVNMSFRYHIQWVLCAKVFNCLTSKHVPLQSLGGFRFRNKITGQPPFNSILWGRSPEEFKELGNSLLLPSREQYQPSSILAPAYQSLQKSSYLPYQFVSWRQMVLFVNQDMVLKLMLWISE